VVATGAEPCGAAGRGTTLWVGVYASGRLIAVDAATGRVTRSIRVGSTPCRVALGGNAAFVALDGPGNVVRVDLRSGRKRVVPVGRGAFDVVRAHGLVWAVSFEAGTVTLLDPRTGGVKRVLRVGEYPTGLASCGGTMWVGHGRASSSLSSIDPRTLRVRHFPVAASEPRRPRCIGGVLWVATPESVLRVDPADGRVIGRLRIGETLGDLAPAPDGLVWVTDKQHSVVHRIDPEGATVVDSFPAGPGAFALARAGDAMWVTSYAGRDVRAYVTSP
jgi:YVTN family beta-propeller protein